MPPDKGNLIIMVDRRTTLKLSALGMTGIMSGFSSIPGQASQKADLPGSIALFNSRYSESRIFSDTLLKLGIQAVDIQNDLGSYWYGQLRSSLASARKPLFGLTDRRDFFCLEELARDLNMKVSLRLDHLTDTRGYTRHQLAGFPALDAKFHQLGHKSGFGKTMAELSEIFLGDTRPDKTVQKLTGPFAPANQTALVTWVIS